MSFGNETVKWLRNPPRMPWWVSAGVSLAGRKVHYLNYSKPVYSLNIETPGRTLFPVCGLHILDYSLPSSILALEMSICLKCLRRPAQVNVLYANEFSDMWGTLRILSILNSGWGTKCSIKSPVKKKKKSELIFFYSTLLPMVCIKPWFEGFLGQMFFSLLRPELFNL